MLIKVKGSDRPVTVADADMHLVSAYSWYATQGPSGPYAAAFTQWNGKQSEFVLMHWVIMGMKGIDHIDGDGFNNQRSNLRPASASENGGNRKKQAGASSQYKGVGWDKTKGKWKAHIAKDKQHYWLGLFKVEEEAARAYDDKARELYGPFARLNFPQEGEQAAC
jgi:hypothetical protein